MISINNSEVSMQDNTVTGNGITSGTVLTDTFVMRYFRFGSGDRTMVILPGLSVQSVMNSAEAVAQEYAVFTDDFTVWVFDRSERLSSGYTVFDMAADTAEAFDKLGLSDIYLFGASQGGMIALCIALDHPGLVSKLILGSSACRVSEDQYEVISGWASLAKRKDRAGLYLSFGEKLYPEHVFEAYRPVFVSMAETVTDEELEKFIILAEGTKDFDVSDKIDLISCPVLSIDADDDMVLTPEAGQLIADKLKDKPDFSRFTYSGLGHAVFDTAAPEYQQRMLRFFLDK